MTFPSGPYDQGFPQQPGFSQQPSFGIQPPIYSHQSGFGQQPGYPQPGWPQQPGYAGGSQPTPSRGPSRASAVIAGILALLGGLFGVFYGAVVAAATFGDRDFDAMGAVVSVFSVALGLVLFNGALLLWRRKPIARRLIVGGCAVVILSGITALGDILIGVTGEPSREFDSVDTPIIAGLAFPIVTLVLTMLPSTERWIQEKPSPIAAQYYPPYQR